MCLAQRPQRSDAGEARTRSPSVSSQALYHWATALPKERVIISLLAVTFVIGWYIFVNGLYLVQDRQNVGPELAQNHLTFW